MLAYDRPNLFNEHMDTQTHRTAQGKPAPAPRAPEATGPAPAGSDWQPSKGIIDSMSAYRDWWNMPTRRPKSRAPRSTARPRPSDRD